MLSEICVDYDSKITGGHSNYTMCRHASAWRGTVRWCGASLCIGGAGSRRLTSRDGPIRQAAWCSTSGASADWHHGKQRLTCCCTHQPMSNPFHKCPLESVHPSSLVRTGKVRETGRTLSQLDDIDGGGTGHSVSW